MPRADVEVLPEEPDPVPGRGEWASEGRARRQLCLVDVHALPGGDALRRMAIERRRAETEATEAPVDTSRISVSPPSSP